MIVSLCWPCNRLVTCPRCALPLPLDLNLFNKVWKYENLYHNKVVKYMHCVHVL